LQAFGGESPAAFLFSLGHEGGGTTARALLRFTASKAAQEFRIFLFKTASYAMRSAPDTASAPRLVLH
jgi:hypothetical protein